MTVLKTDKKRTRKMVDGDLYPSKPRAYRAAILFSSRYRVGEEFKLVSRWIICTVKARQNILTPHLRVIIKEDTLTDPAHKFAKFWPGNNWLSRDCIKEIRPLKTKKDYFLFAHRSKMDKLVSLST